MQRSRSRPSIRTIGTGEDTVLSYGSPPTMPSRGTSSVKPYCTATTSSMYYDRAGVLDSPKKKRSHIPIKLP